VEKTGAGRWAIIQGKRVLIFVTVGSELAFDRMLSVVDAWAADSGEDIFAQTGPSELSLTNIRHKPFLSPDEFNQHVMDCSVMIAHAGMGSILAAMQQGRPIIIIPRRVKFRETRNDHQVATTQELSSRAGIFAAMDEAELKQQLERVHLLVAGNAVSSYASNELITAISQFIDE